MDNNWGKDKNYVWYQDKIVKTADATSFNVDKSGLPKDKRHVFVYDVDMRNFRPSKCNMDVATAEHFVLKIMVRIGHGCATRILSITMKQNLM